MILLLAALPKFIIGVLAFIIIITIIFNGDNDDNDDSNRWDNKNLMRD